jgi:5'(3')-deoxyribonucleotidase
LLQNHQFERLNNMIDPAAVAFDVDGVIADTMALFIDIARDEYAINGIRYEDMTCYMLEECLDIDPDIINAILDQILNGNYSGSLQPIAGAGGVLARIARYRRPLLFVTARPYADTIRDWLHEIVPVDPDAVQVEATGTFEGKTAVLLNNGIRYFIEDRLETCFQLKDVGIEPIVYSQPWNRRQHPFIEVQNWCELEDLIAFEGN